MNNKNYWETSRYIPKTSFDSYIAKNKKKEYNQNSTVNNQNTYSAFTKSYQKNKNAFDNDAVANSALDYLYSYNNRGKTQSFLENNGFPTAEDREYNKEYYGVQEENNRMRDLLKTKTNDIFNPKIPDKTDRLFLSGFLGDEEEEQNYQNEVKNANRAIADLQNAFRGSQFENQINGIAKQTTQKINSTPKITHAVNYNPNAKNEYKPIGTYDPNKEPAITQLAAKANSTSNNRRDSIWSSVYDEQGKDILSRWLFGDGTEYVLKDDYWGNYMKSSKDLTSKVKNIVLPLANDLGLNKSKDVDITTHMEIENGEGIVGHQFLHGTDSTVGNFQIKGKVYKDEKGNVTYDLNYTWNDIIDPNYGYLSDRVKAGFVKALPFIDPKDYTIRISWHDKTTIKANPGKYNQNTGWLQ